MEAICNVIFRETDTEVTEFTPLSDLGLDSLDFLDLLLAIEQQTGKSVPENKIAELHTVGDIIRLAA